MSLYIGEDKIGKVVVGTQSSDGGINTDDATLTSGAQMLSPYTSYSKGVKYTGTIPTRTDSNMTVSGNTVTAAAGYYANATSKAVPTVSLATPSISVNSSTGLITATETQSAGYVAASETSNTQQLTTQAAKTVTPGDSSQVAVAAGRYTTGAVTVAAVDADGVTFTSNGTYTPDSGSYYNSVTVNVPTSGGDSSPNLQDKTVSYTPTESTQTDTVSASSGYDGLNEVTVNIGAISSSYVGSGVTQRSSTDLTVSGATVTAPAGYYGSAATKTIASGTAGTPTATKGTVNNHAITVTPSVTNTAGYIAGGTISGTGVSVSASELVSGNRAITENGTNIDVTNYATVSVDVASVGSAYMVTMWLFGSPTGYSGIDEDAWFEYSGNSYYGSVAVNSGDTVRFCIYRNSHNIQSITLSGNTLYLSGSTDLFTYDNGYYYYDISNVQYDLSVDINYYSGSAATPATTITANPSISVNSSTGLITATASANQNVTPTISEGYVSSGTAGAITVSGSNTSQLTTKAAATYNTSTTDQTISAGQFLTGTQTIKAVTVSGLSASSILSGTTVKIGDANDDDRIASVTGTVVIQHYYTGSSAPSASTGSDGDIYLQTGA